MGMFSMIEVQAEVLQAGFHCVIDNSGGGVFCIYAGAQRTTSDNDIRWACIAGPGFADPAYVFAGLMEDFFVGPDSYENDNAVALSETSAVTPVDIARLIVAQATRLDPTQALTRTELEQLGLIR